MQNVATIAQTVLRLDQLDAPLVRVSEHFARPVNDRVIAARSWERTEPDWSGGIGGGKEFLMLLLLLLLLLLLMLLLLLLLVVFWLV